MSSAFRFALLALPFSLLAACGGDAPEEKAKPAARAALSVTLATPRSEAWPQVLAANGNVVAWQEAVIGAETGNQRLTDVRVQVGDRVRKGDVLARIDAETASAEVAEAKASVAELEAALAEAKANAGRARELREKGFYSAQMATQYQTAEQAGLARLAAARARLDAAQLRLARTAIRAPDEGVISARTAAVGSLTQAGQELFRLIRGGRLEWRAEIPAADLLRLKAGSTASLRGPNGELTEGKVRMVAPSVDPATRNGLVYVDLPASTGLKAGMFARGEFALGEQPAWVVPQAAVVLREGFAYVYRLEGEDRVAQTKVKTGRQRGDAIEILDGLPDGARVVASGAGFLADGDRVQVVTGAQ